MKKIIILASICFIIFFISCEKVGKVCHVSDPLTELPWLESMKDINNISISKVILKDKEKKKKIEGFLVGPNKPYPDAQSTFVNCSGEVLCYVGGIAGEMCEKYELIKEEIIYVTE